MDRHKFINGEKVSRRKKKFQMSAEEEQKLKVGQLRHKLQHIGQRIREMQARPGNLFESNEYMRGYRDAVGEIRKLIRTT